MRKIGAAPFGRPLAKAAFLSSPRVSDSLRHGSNHVDWSGHHLTSRAGDSPNEARPVRMGAAGQTRPAGDERGNGRADVRQIAVIVVLSLAIGGGLLWGVAGPAQRSARAALDCTIFEIQADAQAVLAADPIDPTT